MFTLEEITTSDGLIHQGIVAYSPKPTNTALLWIHGLSSTFYNNVEMLTILAKIGASRLVTVGAFNTRGHDMITGIRKLDKTQEKGYGKIVQGAGYEIFEESILDIQAAIDRFKTQGYTRIYLVGHSSGANKACFFAGTQKEQALKGVVLLSPMSDRLIENSKTLSERLQKCETLISRGREDALVTDISFFPLTAKRYVSLMSQGSVEDQFGYGEDPPSLPYFQQIVVPILLLFAENDEYADRSIEKIQDIFASQTRSPLFQSKIIANSLHSFSGKETIVSENILQWIESSNS